MSIGSILTIAVVATIFVGAMADAQPVTNAPAQTISVTQYR